MELSQQAVADKSYDNQVLRDNFVNQKGDPSIIPRDKAAPQTIGDEKEYLHLVENTFTKVSFQFIFNNI